MRTSVTDRTRELHLLRGLLAVEALAEAEREAFEGMLEWLAGAERGHLSRKQREWVDAAAERHEVDDGADPAERNRNVPRGAEVAPAWDASRLPKRPPGRRA